ncbi:glycosyltransferase family A protein [Flavobacterium sp.]|uniref:glycosyltransferase family 2 protein n=2 Tax=Flavobacterium TaxID=237 RepID=UPI00286A375E|nr:glycosyltransferase family A protein [Flavobacterium sp.]
MNNPQVSIIVPCFNQAQYLSEALKSVLEQTYENWECIIVNDGSPDDTKQIAQKWVEKDSRFKYIFKENGGLSSARNEGINYAKGTFILPLDADDRIGLNYVSFALNAFQNDDELKVVYCKAEKFGNAVGEWKLPYYSRRNLAIDNMIFCSGVFKKSDWELVGGYDVKMIYGLEDWEFWIAILKNGGTVKCLDEVNFYCRIKTKSMIEQLNVEKRKTLFEYLSIKHADFFVTQFGSFMYLNDVNRKQTLYFKERLKSKKFVLKLFIKTTLSYFKIK